MAECICPNCGKPIYDDEALLCLYCGESLNRSFGFLGGMKYSFLRYLIYIVTGVVLAGFILLFLR